MAEKLIFGLEKTFYDQLINIVKRFPKVNKILIYGSRANNTAKPWSDFDLAVFAPDMSDQEFALLWNELMDVPLVFKLDIVHWDRLGDAKFKEKILKESQNFFPF